MGPESKPEVEVETDDVLCLEPRPHTHNCRNWPNLVCTLPAGHRLPHRAFTDGVTWEWLEPKSKSEAEVEPDDEPVMVRSEKAFVLAMGCLGLGILVGIQMGQTNAAVKPRYAAEWRVADLERRLCEMAAYEAGKRERPAGE